MASYLRLLTEDAGWSDYRAFLRAFKKAATEEAQETSDAAIGTLVVSERTVERWMAGRHRPQNDAARVLVRMFHRSIAELFSEAPGGPVTASAVGIAAGLRPIPGEITPSHFEPRVVQSADHSSMGRQAAMAARRAIEFAMGTENNSIGTETLGYLHEEIRRIAEIYPRVPLASVLADLTAAQDQTFRLLEGGRAKPSQIRDLYLLAALASGLLAKASHDLGDPRAAMMQARTAAVCSEQAEHTAMSAWAKGLQSLISYWADRPEDALYYARTGAAMASRLKGSVGIWLAGLEARAAASLGDVATVTAAGDRATTLREGTQPDLLDDIGGLLFFSRNRQLYYHAESRVQLGPAMESGQLRTLATEAVVALADHDDPNWAYGDEAGARTNLALAHLYSGELDGAADAIQPVLDLGPDHRNAGIIVSVERVRAALSTEPLRGAAVARQLREEISAFGAHSPLALPR